MAAFSGYRLSTWLSERCY